MKKLIASVIVFLLVSLMLVSCVTTDTGESSSSPSGVSSQTFAPSESGASKPADISGDASSDTTSDETSGDASGDTSKDPETEGLVFYEDLPECSCETAKVMKSCRISYTKVSPIEAKKAVSDATVSVTAIYDGKITRFFKTTGDYISSVAGDYTEHSSGVFYNGDTGYSFKTDKDGNVTMEKIKPFGTGKVSAINIYESCTGNVFMLEMSEEGISAYRRKDGQAVAAIELACKNGDELGFYNGKLTDCGDTSKVRYDGEFHLDSEGMYSVGKYGVYNGKDIVPFEYDLVTGGDSGVFRAEKDGRVFYFSSDGTRLGSEKGYTVGSDVIGNHAWVFDGTHGYVLAFS